MAFIDCIKGKVKAGLLTKKQVETLENRFNGLLERYRNSMGSESAASQAATDIIEAEANIIATKKRNEINGALAQVRITKQLDDEVSRTGVSYDSAVRNLLEQGLVRKQSILKQYLTNLDDFVDQFKSKLAGLKRRTDGMADVVAEMLGKGTGNAEAKQFAGALRRVFDQAHKRYKNAGGIIGILENYFPQIHKFELIKQVAFEEWYQFIRPRLDIDKMIDFETGLPFKDDKLLRIMRDDYNAIVTKGKSDLIKRAEEGKQTFGFGGEVSARRQSGRFYHFRDADAFLEYNERFGVGDVGLFDSVINHLESFARDTGLLEILGPKPNALMRHLDLQMSARGVGIAGQKWTRGMYDVLTGFVDTEVGEPTWFRASASLRNIFVAAYLGRAVISAIADTAFMAATAKLNGLPATKVLRRYLKLLNPLSSKDRKLARQAGYIAGVARGSALADARFSGETMGGKATSWIAQFTLRAQGLRAVTNAAADAMSLEMEGNLARLLDDNVSWSNLDRAFRDNLEAHGMTEADWQILGKAERFEPEQGVRFIRSEQVATASGVDRDAALNAATKLDDVINSMRNLAVNEPTLRTRAITTGAALGDARRGTLLRSIAASVVQFKSFPITVMFNHVLRAMETVVDTFKGDFNKSRLQHAGFTFIGATIMGAVSLQITQIIIGKDIRDFDDWRFWAAAALQGGGLGLFGDFLFQDYSRFGRSFAEELVGPTAGFVSDFIRTLQGDLNRILDEDEDRAAAWDELKADLFRFAKRNTPLNNLWYSRLVVERTILDQLERLIDPEFDRKNELLEDRMLRDTGQEFFWRKGELTPERLPQEAETDF